jgi:SAM-dependent methyltransferase
MDLDVPGRGEKAMQLGTLRNTLKENIRRESAEYFGLDDPDWLEEVTGNWFNDEQNYDGRWRVIARRVATVGKVLDMAAGCGTFVLNGLLNQRDVYGIEPEEWKRLHFRNKILASGYPDVWQQRIVCAKGESLPFPDRHFDLVTTYQTLEHVQSVGDCLRELLRVLKDGGILYLRAPDYDSWYEPHYRLPFLPRMNKALAARYLRLLGRPVKGLAVLNWTTERDLVALLNASGHRLAIERSARLRYVERQAEIEAVLPPLLRNPYVTGMLNAAWAAGLRLRELLMVGRREKHVDLWITKLDHGG